MPARRSRSLSRAARWSGAVGAGAGMVTFGYKGGIGTASRVAEGGAIVGVLLLTNFGSREDLRVDGVPVGPLLPGPRPDRVPPAGSCIAIVATDAPLAAADLARLARRAGLGLARSGSVAHNGSGEIFLAFSTGARAPRDDGRPIGTRVGRGPRRALRRRGRGHRSGSPWTRSGEPSGPWAARGSPRRRLLTSCSTCSVRAAGSPVLRRERGANGLFAEQLEGGAPSRAGRRGAARGPRRAAIPRRCASRRSARRRGGSSRAGRRQHDRAHAGARLGELVRDCGSSRN